MKKILLSALAATLVLGACKKDENVSQIVTASYPTVTFTGSKFYSINVGSSAPSVAATAFDSTLGESYPTTLDASGIDVNTPGLYVVQVTATNRNGYIGSDAVYIAVTDVTDDLDLSGEYRRTANNDVVNVTKIARGLFLTDNAGGAPTLRVPAYFAVLNDTTIDLPLQPVLGTATVGVRTPDVPDAYGTLLMEPAGDTLFSYAFNNGDAGFATGNARTFVKQ